jgi:hypothetical protein
MIDTSTHHGLVFPDRVDWMTSADSWCTLPLLRAIRVLDSDFDRQRILFRITFTVCVITALALIWSYRFLPISDYPDLIFEGSVVAKLLRGEPLASYSFKHYPVPYSGTIAMLGPLDLILTPEVSGKVVLSLCVILLALSSTYLLRSLRRDANNTFLTIPLLFLLNTFFFWGELAYLLGLSVLFLYCAYLFRRIYRSEPINWWLIAAASIAMFFFHFVSYATAILVTLTLVLVELRTELLIPFAVSFGPSIGTSIWYAVGRSSLKQMPLHWTFWTPHQFAGRWLAAFSLFPEFLPWLGIQAPWMKVLAILNLVVAIALTLVIPLCILLWTNIRTRYTGVLASAVVCGVAVIASGYEFEGMVSPGERFLYPAVWIGLCWLVGADLPGRVSAINRVLTLGLLCLLAGQIVFMLINVGAVSNDLAALYSKLQSATSRTEFCETYETYLQRSWDKPHRTGLDVLLTNHASAPRLPYYLYLEKQAEAPIFQVGILNYTGHEDNENLCKSQ